MCSIITRNHEHGIKNRVIYVCRGGGGVLTLQVPGLLHARALAEETLDVAGQHAVVVQHLFHVELLESLHVGGQVLNLVVGGRSGGLGATSVHGDAAKSDENLAVHDGRGQNVQLIGIICSRECLDGTVLRHGVLCAQANTADERVLTFSANEPILYTRSNDYATTRLSRVGR